MNLNVTGEELDLMVQALALLVAHGEARSRKKLPRRARLLIEKLNASQPASANYAPQDSGIARAFKESAGTRTN
jgi:hypothetical protein